MSKLFYAHDVRQIEAVDREADRADAARAAEIYQLEQRMHKNYDEFLRSGAADKLLALRRKGG